LRSQTALGISMYWSSTYKYGGPLSSNVTYNPDFYDWNHAFFVYCDGASFSGDVEQPVNVQGKLIYYRGHRILLATINDLLKKKGLDKATDVLVVGDSAGAMATYYHVNELKSLMPKSVTRFKAAPFSGVFLDHLNAEGKTVFRDNMRQVFNLHNASGGVNQKCIAAQSPDEHYKCFFAQYTLEYTDAPIMPIGSATDIIGTACVIGGEPTIQITTSGVGNCSAVPGWTPCEINPQQCTNEQWKLIEGYADDFAKVIENNPKLKQDGNGLFEYNCHTHAVETSDAWMLFASKGVVMRDAVRDWFFSDNEPTQNHFYKDCVNHGSYSCNPTCSLPIR